MSPVNKKHLSLDQALQDNLNKQCAVSLNIPQSKLEHYQKLFATSSQVRSVLAFKLVAPRSESQKDLGILYLGFEKKRDLKLELGFGKTIAKEASSAIQHTWSIRRYKRVAEIGQQINRDLQNPEQIFRLLTRGISKIIDANYFLMLAIYNQHANKLDHYMFEKRKPELDLDCKLEGACKYVIENNKGIFVRNYKEERADLKKQGIKIVHRDKTERVIPDSMMFIPLTIRGTTLGVLSVQQIKENFFDNEDRQILELLSHYVALAISNLRWKQGLEKLINTGQELTQKLDVANAMQEVVDLLRVESEADIAALHPYDHRSMKFMFPVIYSGDFLDKKFPRPIIALADDMASFVLHKGEAIFCNSGDLYKRVGGTTKRSGEKFEVREKMVSVAALPLQIGNKPVGVLFLNFRQKQLFLGAQKSFLEGLAFFLAIALINSGEFQDINQRI